MITIFMTSIGVANFKQIMKFELAIAAVWLIVKCTLKWINALTMVKLCLQVVQVGFAENAAWYANCHYYCPSILMIIDYGKRGSDPSWLLVLFVLFFD